MKTKAAEQLAQLQAQHDKIQSLKEDLESAVTDRDASQRSLAELLESSRSKLTEQHDTAKKLQQQLTDAQTKLSQLQSDRAEEVQSAEAHTEATSKHRQEVSDLQAQLKKAEEEVASLEDTRSHLQQHLGERTIVLGQKAHQIAHLTAQLNEARALSSSSPGLGESSLPFFAFSVFSVVFFFNVLSCISHLRECTKKLHSCPMPLSLVSMCEDIVVNGLATIPAALSACCDP